MMKKCGVYEKSGVTHMELTSKSYHPLHLPHKSDAVMERAAAYKFGLYRELNQGH